MKRTIFVVSASLFALGPAAAQSQIKAIAPLPTSYPALSEYMMTPEAETALAKSAAPASISRRATIKLLTPTGYAVASTGDNGFVCTVLRGWMGPSYTPQAYRDLVYDGAFRAPICFDAIAARTVLPYYELRAQLGMARKTPDQITAAVQAAYDKGELPKRETVSFAYMVSADMNLGPGIGPWHPHLMIFAPNYSSAMIGNLPYGGPWPQVTDDGGTPFAVIVSPIDNMQAQKMK